MAEDRGVDTDLDVEERRKALQSLTTNDDPYIFKRFPYEVREHWLTAWNKENDPSKVTCIDAFDVAMYCITPGNQFRNLYRTGDFPKCKEAWSDIKLCLKVKGMVSYDKDRARVLLKDHSKRKDEEYRHVWKFRSEPPRFFATSSSTKSSMELTPQSDSIK